MDIRQWYYVVDGQRVGPIAENNLFQMFRGGRLRPDTMVWTSELKDWMEARSVAGLLENAARMPRPFQQGYQAAAPSAQLYAGFWKRFAAALIDSIVLMAGGFIVGFGIGIVYGATMETAEGLEFFCNIIGVILGWLYNAVFESSAKQATLGKMALGIKVTDLAGNRISFARATGRHFGKIISTVLLFIGFLMIAFTERKQGLHDMMAECLVVNE
ncbi:MAG: RDD family protein [Planctomycetota bacterium]|jgi:uncharacterized RDD family membrane protein YckC